MKSIMITLAFAMAMPAMAYQSLLGTTELYKDFLSAPDVDQIYVGQCGYNHDNPPIKKVQIRVHENDIHLEEIVATFGNGQKQTFNVREYFQAGSRSRWIDLHGNLRCIESLKLVGNTVTNGWVDAIVSPKATVEVWGKRNQAPQSQVSRVMAQDVKFGQGQNFKWHTKMVRSCANQNKKFKKLRLKARKGRLKIKKLIVTYGNGSTQQLYFKSDFFYKNQVSQWKDLDGHKRCIKKIQYKALSPNGARLVVQGR